jgi:uncharacterized protein DUF4241
MSREPALAGAWQDHISLTVSCKALSTSFGDTSSSLAVCFSALVTAFLIASSTLLSPTMTSPAWPGSMKSPSCFASDRDIPLARCPLTPPITPPAAAAPRTAGGKMTPTAAPAATPHQAAVAPGEYPVLLSLVRWMDNPRHRRVAAARLAIGGEPVASWELALLPGQDLRILGDRAFFGFGVDAGMGCFFDAAAAPAMARHSPTFALGDDTTGELNDPESGANLIAFDSGWGDGAYPTWIGRTTSGDIACFVADMLLLGDNAVPDPEQL